MLMKNKKVFLIVAIFASIVVGFLLFLLIPFPTEDTIIMDYPKNFQILKSNYFEVQPPNQCAGYATAYVLRHFDKETTGKEVYRKLSCKIPISGYVLPKGIIKYFQTDGFNVKIYRGSLASLKSSLAQGVPTIVLIGKGLSWQHYMTLVGYASGEKELYFYDSKKTNDENGSLPGNRTLSEEYFLKLWNNGLPVFNKIYFKVDIK